MARAKTPEQKEARRGTPQKEFTPKATYDSLYTSNGPVRLLSEARDLLYRKWRVEEDVDGNMWLQKVGKHSGKVLRRPISYSLFCALGKHAGIHAFTRADSSEQVRIIQRTKIDEQRAHFAEGTKNRE